MIDVVAESGNEEAKLVQRPEERVDSCRLHDREGRVRHAHGMRQVVKRVGMIPSLSPLKKAAQLLVGDLQHERTFAPCDIIFIRDARVHSTLLVLSSHTWTVKLGATSKGSGRNTKCNVSFETQYLRIFLGL